MFRKRYESVRTAYVFKFYKWRKFEDSRWRSQYYGEVGFQSREEMLQAIVSSA